MQLLNLLNKIPTELQDINIELSRLHILCTLRNHLISRIPSYLGFFLLIALKHHYLLHHIVKYKVITS
jgi:hypothetical protein